MKDLPCHDCIVFSMCDIYDYKFLEKCPYFKKFIHKTLFKKATNIVKKDPEKMGFHYFAFKHPTKKSCLFGVNLLIHKDAIYIKGCGDLRIG